MATFRMNDHRTIAASAPEPVHIGNGHRIVHASAQDVARWRADPSTPMYDPAARQVAASAPVSAAAPAPTADEFKVFMHLLGGPFRQHGTPPPSGAFDIPAVPGSASDPNTAHLGCAAQSARGDDGDTRGTVDYGTPRYVTSSTCHLLPIVNPRGGKRLDIYGPHKPIPHGALTDEQVRHLLDHGMIEHTDGKGNIDHLRVDEALSVIICCIAEEEGSESWGRPRIAEAVRRAGYRFSNETLGLAIKRWHSPPVPERISRGPGKGNIHSHRQAGSSLRHRARQDALYQQRR